MRGGCTHPVEALLTASPGQAWEVADMLNIPLGTVVARLHRGRKLFEKHMWDYAETSGLRREEAREK